MSGQGEGVKDGRSLVTINQRWVGKVILTRSIPVSTQETVI